MCRSVEYNDLGHIWILYLYNLGTKSIIENLTTLPDSKVHWANMGPSWAPCWPNEPCYLDACLTMSCDTAIGLPRVYHTRIVKEISRAHKFEIPLLNKMVRGRVTHICVSKLTICGSDNGLSPGRRQAIIWTNAGTLWIGPLGTYFSQI